jgi:hypothetical protein
MATQNKVFLVGSRVFPFFRMSHALCAPDYFLGFFAKFGDYSYIDACEVQLGRPTLKTSFGFEFSDIWAYDGESCR